jgi:antitoxin component YwqK of YwqJK toxin-antitoxin module
MWTEKGPPGQPTVREGLFKSFLPDGRLESTIEYHDGKKNGDAKFWSKDGRLSFQGRYQGDFLVYEKRFDDLGRKVLERNFKIKNAGLKALGPDGDSIEAIETCAWTDGKDSNPLRHGLCNLTYADGKPLANRYYQLGHLHGLVKAWYPNGGPWMEGFYERDIPTGKWRNWTPGGKPLWSFSYKLGEKDGLSEEWFPDGKIKSKSYFTGGKMHGRHQEWYPNGKIRLRTEFQLGKRVGPEMTWHPDGSKLYSAGYLAGKLDGDFYQWYPGGRLRLHCRFREGRKEGLSRVWYRHGVVLEQASFREGRLHGAYRTWGPEGNPLSTKEFRDGAVAFDSKAKELLELLGADQVRVPVGLLGFYWGMSTKDCRSNLSLMQATHIRIGMDEITARVVAFMDHDPSEAKIRIQFNAQGELWGIKLDILQKNSGDFFTICENLESEIGSELGAAGLRKSENANVYYMTRRKEWGKFTVTTGTGEDSSAAISAVLPVVSAEGFSPGDRGWFRFSLANHLYREYANPANAEITPPSWPEDAFLAGK